MDAEVEEAIVDLVDVGEVVGAGLLDLGGGKAGVLVLGVGIEEADVVVEDAVEADGLKSCGLLHGAHVLAVVVAEGEDGAAGAEGLFPDVGERGGGGVGVDGDGLGGLGLGDGERGCEEAGGEEEIELQHGFSLCGGDPRTSVLKVLIARRFG